VTVTRVLWDGNQGAVEWLWRELRRSDGTWHSAEDAIIFVVENEEIVYWREYFDTARF
jgi:limonene-1,2-epoxide hydrolase